MMRAGGGGYVTMGGRQEMLNLFLSQLFIAHPN